MTIPTIPQMIKVYVDAARIERLKCGRPSEGTVRNTICGVNHFIRWINEKRLARGFEYLGLEDNFPLVSIIKAPLIHRYLSELLNTPEIRPISAMSYVNQLRQLFSKWVRPYYDDHAWKVPQFPPFGKKPRSPRYNRPSKEILNGIKDWYQNLSKLPVETTFQGRRSQISAGQLWFAATMMLEFAMRNADIMRLGRHNFVEWEGRTYLNYTPHKTEYSSGRSVKWPVHTDILDRIKKASSGDELPVLDNEVFRLLNIQMRALGFTGTKGAYELRKICVDHVYQKFGAEMAVSISGDDIKTICHYYADPSQPNIGSLRILDLI